MCATHMHRQSDPPNKQFRINYTYGKYLGLRSYIWAEENWFGLQKTRYARQSLALKLAIRVHFLEKFDLKFLCSARYIFLND